MKKKFVHPKTGLYAHKLDVLLNVVYNILLNYNIRFPPSKFRQTLLQLQKQGVIKITKSRIYSQHEDVKQLALLIIKHMGINIATKKTKTVKKPTKPKPKELPKEKLKETKETQKQNAKTLVELLRESLKGKEIHISEKARKMLEQGQLSRIAILIGEQSIGILTKWEAKEIVEQQEARKNYDAFLNRMKERITYICKNHPQMFAILWQLSLIAAHIYALETINTPKQELLQNMLRNLYSLLQAYFSKDVKLDVNNVLTYLSGIAQILDDVLEKLPQVQLILENAIDKIVQNTKPEEQQEQKEQNTTPIYKVTFENEQYYLIQRHFNSNIGYELYKVYVNGKFKTFEVVVQDTVNNTVFFIARSTRKELLLNIAQRVVSAVINNYNTPEQKARLILNIAKRARKLQFISIQYPKQSDYEQLLNDLYILSQPEQELVSQ